MTAPFPVPGGEAHAHAQAEHDIVLLPKPEFRIPGPPDYFIDGYGHAHDIDCRGCRIDALLAEVARLTAMLAESGEHDRAEMWREKANAYAARCVTLTEAIDSYRRLGDGMVTSAADEDAGTVTEVHTLDALERLHAVLAGSSGGEKP